MELTPIDRHAEFEWHHQRHTAPRRQAPSPSRVTYRSKRGRMPRVPLFRRLKDLLPWA